MVAGSFLVLANEAATQFLQSIQSRQPRNSRASLASSNSDGKIVAMVAALALDEAVVLGSVGLEFRLVSRLG